MPPLPGRSIRPDGLLPMFKGCVRMKYDDTGLSFKDRLISAPASGREGNLSVAACVYLLSPIRSGRKIAHASHHPFFL